MEPVQPNQAPQPTPEHSPTGNESLPVPEVTSPPPAQPPATPPPINTTPAPPTVTPQPAVTTDASSSPAVADDVDVIEKEWVDAAEHIVHETEDDPYRQEEAIDNLQADYLKKRYGKDIKKSSES